jgi:lantibiotic biosynthesis protein
MPVLQPIVTHSKPYKLFEKQVVDIAREIPGWYRRTTNVGLLSGKAGIALLFAYLSKHYDLGSYEKITFDILSELNECLCKEDLDYHLSTGVAGIGFVFQHLRNIDVLDRNEDLNLSELDKFLDFGITRDLAENNWDPLHGMVGLGIYYLERNSETGEEVYLARIVDGLLQMCIGKNKVWITRGFDKYNKDNFNFGMAHGMPGLLSFLAQVHTRKIRQPEIEEVMACCISFLLQYERGEESIYSFPTLIELDEPVPMKDSSSRLAWCYGDLCVSNALIHCGKALGRDDWERKGIEVALKTTCRTLANSGCLDASFCHGTVGLMHQYHRLYRATGNETFKQSCENWLEISLREYYKPGEGIGGYTSWTYNEAERRFSAVPSIGLLEGSAGIALVYLSWLCGIEPAWDIIFQTNV